MNMLSIFLVFLTENFESKVTPCDECGAMLPRFGRVFNVGSKWVCADCIFGRIISA
jgi:hypothetical protein